MVAVMWGRVMDLDDTQADASATTEDATPGKVVQLRTFTKVYNDYYDTLIGVVSPSAYYIMHYLVRQTWGFHRDATRSSLTAICEATKLSRHTVITGLRELDEMHIVTSDAGERGRTQVRSYQMHLPDTWTLPTQTSAKNALVDKQKRTSVNTAPVTPKTSANPALDAAPTSAKIAPILKKEDLKKKEKENSAASAAPRTPRKPKTERVLSPDHQYRVDLIAAVSAIRGGKSPNHDAEWKAAGDLFHWSDLGPAPIADVADCFALEQRAPHWDTDTLTLNALIKPFRAYQRSGRAAYAEAVKRKRAAANGVYDMPRASQNGHRRQPIAAATFHTTDTDNPWSDD